MPNKSFLLVSLILLLSVCRSEQQTLQNQFHLNSTGTKEQLSIDPKRLQQINLVINAHFTNCSLQSQSKVLYDCSIKQQNYAEFLYALFHKELIMNFLKLYQLQGKLQTDKQIGDMFKIGQKVHQLVVSAYKDWIRVYKPNKQIAVEQMYGDIPELDREVLDIIEHRQDKHNDFINVLKKVYKISNTARRYIVMGNKSEQQIAEDYAGILQIYFGDCKPITQCNISIEAFAHFVKELAFYITPLVEDRLNQQSIIVSEQMDFKATEFLMKQTQNMKHVLGQQVDYSELETYSQELAMSLFEHLKQERQQEQNDTQQGPQNDKQMKENRGNEQKEL